MLSFTFSAPKPSESVAPQKQVEAPTTKKKPLAVTTKTKEAPLPVELQSWIQRYASSNVIVALNKRAPSAYHIKPAYIETVLRGRSTIPIESDLEYRGKPFKPFDLMALPDSTLFGDHPFDPSVYDAEASPELLERRANRNLRMIENMQKLLLNRRPDELILVDVGASHAVDFFLAFYLKGPDNPLLKVRHKPLYFSNTLTATSRLESHGLQKANAIMRGIEEEPKTIRHIEATLPGNFLSRLYFHRNLAADRYSLAGLMEEPSPEFGFLVLLDLHGLESIDALEKLPSAQALKSLKFKKVVLATENFEFGKAYSLESYEALGIFTHKNLKDDADRKNKALKAFLDKEVVPFYPSVLAIAAKLRSYKAAGLEVSITGNEEFERLHRPK